VHARSIIRLNYLYRSLDVDISRISRQRLPRHPFDDDDDDADDGDDADDDVGGVFVANLFPVHAGRFFHQLNSF